MSPRQLTQGDRELMAQHEAAAADLPCPPGRRHRNGRRKGFTETGYARLLDAAHQQLRGPLVVVWDNLNTHVSDAMADLVAARDWLTVYRLPPYAHELNPAGPALGPA